MFSSALSFFKWCSIWKYQQLGTSYETDMVYLTMVVIMNFDVASLLVIEK